ncbi:ribosome maturation factor RimM [Candidatus Viridilinea mediisalina]|uniref:Ribosome maturation factor RimM n=1 Tax=Candidatus Viridilinea mediisalina TaxID=2024553 RepID=A0A2A6RG63_9CHLR|nr:ribosome maturation factor RimM [Candidatus Viridilinea mediisalina]PDW02057.1 16S rRNA processing protein RimM [Candidatus Viridilinea mediisalina]
MDDLLLIGFVAAPFGVQGQLKVKGFTDRPDHIARHVRTLYLQQKGQPQPYQLARLHEHKPGILIMTLQGVNDREAADALRGAEIYIREADAAPLAEDEYFIHQLIGIKAFTTTGTLIGNVRDVLTTGSGDVLIIARPDQSDALVPMVRDFIASLDLVAGQVTIKPVEGLL